jgi:hypothetical protein
MEMSHRNALYIYLKQIKMSFFFYKTKNRRAEQVLSGGLVPVGAGRSGERVIGE